MSTLLLLLGLACSTTTPVESTPAAGAPQAAPQATGSTRNIDVNQLSGDLDAGKVPLLVDVRTPGEFSSGHVPGAVNIPLDQITSRTGELAAAKDGELYLICQSGGRSGRAASQLQAMGWNTVNVQGGTGAWISAGKPTE